MIQVDHIPSLDQAFHALADPTRRTLVEQLASRPRSVSELAEPFEMSLPGVLQHLQVLEASGLIVSEKAGRVRTCRLQPEALDEVERWIAERRTRCECRLDRLGHYLDARGNDPSEEGRGDDP